MSTGLSFFFVINYHITVWSETRTRLNLHCACLWVYNFIFTFVYLNRLTETKNCTFGRIISHMNVAKCVCFYNIFNCADFYIFDLTGWQQKKMKKKTYCEYWIMFRCLTKQFFLMTNDEKNDREIEGKKHDSCRQRYDNYLFAFFFFLSTHKQYQKVNWPCVDLSTQNIVRHYTCGLNDRRQTDLIFRKYGAKFLLRQKKYI